MIYRSHNWGISAWCYNPAIDENEWELTIGFGGQATHDSSMWSIPYRYGISIVWRKLTNCVNWWGEYLGTERGRGVVMQYRVHSFREWPISIRFYKVEMRPLLRVFVRTPLLLEAVIRFYDPARGELLSGDKK